MRHPFNAQHERERKRGLELLMQRSREQDEAENEVLQQAAQVGSSFAAPSHSLRRFVLPGLLLSRPPYPSGSSTTVGWVEDAEGMQKACP